jgi:hypothetical protein
MKKIFSAATLVAFLFSAVSVTAQDDDKSKRPSPPAMARMKLASGATIKIDYSQPSLKGRTMGKDVEPMKDKIWRAGANEATVFSTDQAVTVEGKTLQPGKYAVFMIDHGDTWTVIFNKTWDQMGAYSYKQEEDVFRITVKPVKSAYKVERLTYNITRVGKVSLLWGDVDVSFSVK